MGISLAGMLAQGERISYEATVTSNQDDGLVSYAFGRVEVTRGRVFGSGPGSHSTRDTVHSLNGEDLTMLFSDRLFDANNAEKLFLEITAPFGSGPAMIDLRVVGWSKQNSRFAANSLSDLLVGIGPPLSGNSPHAVFTFSFSQLPTPPH
jgi:hypothetical protein